MLHPPRHADGTRTRPPSTAIPTQVGIHASFGSRKRALAHLLISHSTTLKAMLRSRLVINGR